jgi:phosphoglycolate phosphatase-like HAD superfamily hydrolase
LLEKIRLLILDLDYLVIDCAALRSKTLRKCLLRFADQIPTDARLPDSIDIEDSYLEGGFEWLSALQLGLNEESALDLNSDYAEQEARLLEAGGCILFPGVKDLMAGCIEAGVAIALGADAGRSHLMSVIDSLSLDRYFKTSLCTEEFGSGSVDEMLEELLSHSEVNPSEAIMLATRNAYFDAARSLSLPSIGCGWGLQQKRDFSAANYQSPSLAHLLPLIRQADAIASSSFD